MSIDPSRAEDIPSDPSSEFDSDVVAEKPDPKKTYAAFETKHAAWKAAPSDLTWHEFRRAYRDFKASVSAAVLVDLWKRKRDPRLEALLDYGAEADRRYKKSPARKKTKAKFDRRNAHTEHRKDQCREARRKYRERQRAAKATEKANPKKEAKRS